MSDLLSNLSLGFGVALTLNNLWLCFVGCMVGTLIGVVTGVLLALNIAVVVPFIESMAGFKVLSPEIYYLSELPSELRWNDVWATAFIALSLSLLATLYPSWRASKVNPAEALRYE